MESMQQVATCGAKTDFPGIINGLKTAARKAKSSDRCKNLPWRFEDGRLCGHKLRHFPFALVDAPFFGIEIVAGGVILCPSEKFPWFRASAIRPRESL